MHGHDHRDGTHTCMWFIFKKIETTDPLAILHHKNFTWRWSVSLHINKLFSFLYIYIRVQVYNALTKILIVYFFSQMEVVNSGPSPSKIKNAMKPCFKVGKNEDACDFPSHCKLPSISLGGLFHHQSFIIIYTWGYYTNLYSSFDNIWAHIHLCTQIQKRKTFVSSFVCMCH